MPSRKVEALLFERFQHFVPDACNHGLNGIRLDNRHGAREFSQKQIGLAVTTDKFQRVLRLPGVCGIRVGVDYQGEVRLGHEFQYEPGENCRELAVERKIRKLVVDIAVEDDDVRATFSGLTNSYTEIHRVGEIKRETHCGNWPGGYVLVAALQGLLRASHARVSFECL